MIEKLKNKRSGILGVLGFLVILILMLIFLGLSKSNTEDELEEATVLVEFEGAEEGVEGGSQNSDIQEEQTPIEEPVDASQPTPEDEMTQEIEDAPEVVEVKPTTNPTTNAEPIDVKPTKDDQPKIFVPTYKPGNNTSADGTGEGQGNGDDRGYGDGTGDKGNGIGKGGSGNNPEILGGSGVSVVSSLDLKPKTSAKGRVLVRVTVDKFGKVVSVEGGVTYRNSSGKVVNSTTTNSELIKTAEADARGSKYNVGPNAKLSQTFYAVFHYNLK